MKDKLRELAERWRIYGSHMTGHECSDELLAILDAEGDGGAVEVCIPFGEGKVVVTTGTHGGMPCVFLAPASIPGVVGESAARENLPLYKRVPGESILTFPTAEQASIVANTLCGKNAHPTRSGVVSDEDVREALVAACGDGDYPSDPEVERDLLDGMRSALEHFARRTP